MQEEQPTFAQVASSAPAEDAGLPPPQESSGRELVMVKKEREEIPGQYIIVNVQSVYSSFTRNTREKFLASSRCSRNVSTLYKGHAFAAHYNTSRRSRMRHAF